MYLTRMELDLTSRNTMRMLNSPGIIHGTVERAFPGERKRRLWRIDRLGGKLYLMILSEDKPDLTSASLQYGIPGRDPAWETRNYDQLLNRIREGSVWHFRLVANPTLCSYQRGENGEKKRGKVMAHVSVPYQSEWLIRQAEKYGFKAEKDDFRVVASKWENFEKGGDVRYKVALRGVTYEGLLTVEDAQKFKDMLVSGMGRGKAYGMGLMTIVHS